MALTVTCKPCEPLGSLTSNTPTTWQCICSDVYAGACMSLPHPPPSKSALTMFSHNEQLSSPFVHIKAPDNQGPCHDDELLAA
jgi:hypothetical protein